MYYLLENNKIVEIHNAEFNEYGLLRVYEETGFYTLLKLDGTAAKYNDYFVKNQSENVFDLIEKGDLVKHQFINAYHELVSTIELVFETNIVFMKKEYISVLGMEIEKNTDFILAIYKPDANGNYIKVWEEKDE